MKRDVPFHKNRSSGPVSTKHLTEEVARPSMTSLRQVWTPSVIANGLTPYRLASILRSAETGNTRPQLELAEAMEERDAHYGSLIRTRRLAIEGLDVTVESHSEDKHDLELAELIRDLVRRPEFNVLVSDLLDGLGKGHSAVEILWEKSVTWEPQYAWRHPTWFTWDKEAGTELRLLDSADMINGLELAPNKWIVHVPRIKAGLPARSGLARLSALAYMCKTWALKDWMAFADTYGLPLRVGKYQAGASDPDIQTLINAVANIASDAGCVIPSSMEIEFVDAVKGLSGGNVMFKALAEYLDLQMSKAILGHSGASDSTPGKLGNENQAEEVRLDILKADAKQLEATINHYLVKAYIDVNVGVQEHYPCVCFPVPEPEDIAVTATALKDLIPLGLQVEQQPVRELLNLPDPEVDASGNPVNDLLHPPATTPVVLAPNQRTAVNREESTPREMEGVIERTADAVDRHVEGWIDTILDAVNEAVQNNEALEDLQERLLTLYGELDPNELARVIGDALVVADLGGRAEVADGE